MNAVAPNILDEVVNQYNVGETNRQVHIFFEGNSWDLSFDNIDVGMLSADAEIRNKTAEALNVPAMKIANYVVERNHETEDVTLRPNAIFGTA